MGGKGLDDVADGDRAGQGGRAVVGHGGRAGACGLLRDQGQWGQCDQRGQAGQGGSRLGTIG